MDRDLQDDCPQCGANGMPKWKANNKWGGKETARACEYCGWVEEREKKYFIDTRINDPFRCE